VLSLPDRLLAVVAHPDDEVLGCGGLLAKVADAGGVCRVLILTEGSTTQYPDRPEYVEQKRAEAVDAAEVLGVREVHFAELPDMQLSTLPSAVTAAPVHAQVGSFEPAWVVTHHADDLNSDHRIAHEACRIATRARPGGNPALLAMEVPSSTEFAYHPLRGNVAVHLTEEHLTRKVDALDAYRSERRPFPHGRSREAVTALASYRGYGSGSALSEVYELVWGTVP
jgi:N-acetylglucosamine malate deacetylase 1